VGAGPAPETSVATFVAPDTTDLLARLAGAIALAGLAVLSADAYRVAPGVALQLYTVASATARPMSTDTFALLERLSDVALRDRYGLGARLRERRAHYPAAKGRPAKVTARASGAVTILEVEAADRVGLLHDVAAAVDACGLQIVWTKARTVGGVAHDVFSVAGPDGGPVSDAGTTGHLVMRVREALS
jgi:[protein-PII] uridylyltransferase